MTALHVIVRGVVQGVGFRYFVRQRARALGLRGWVKNRPDGSVEVAADGAAAALREFRATLEEGPPGAIVHGVDDVAGDAPDLPEHFTIVR